MDRRCVRWISAYHEQAATLTQHSLEKDAQTTISSGERLTARGPVIWISGSMEKFRYWDSETIPCEPGSEAAIPLAHGAWMRATAAAGIEACGTVDAIGRGRCGDGISSFLDLLLGNLTRGLVEDLDADRERLNRRARDDQSIVQAGLSKVASVMDVMRPTRGEPGFRARTN